MSVDVSGTHVTQGQVGKGVQQQGLQGFRWQIGVNTDDHLLSPGCQNQGAIIGGYRHEVGMPDGSELFQSPWGTLGDAGLQVLLDCHQVDGVHPDQIVESRPPVTGEGSRLGGILLGWA